MIARVTEGCTDNNRVIVRYSCFVFAVLFLPIHALDEEETVSINKPVDRGQPPWVRFSTEYIRCFCNLPVCVSTGYMCKSSGGGCFSDLLDHTLPRSAAYRGRHGCVELLTESEQSTWCENIPKNNTRPPHRKKKHPKSLALCCYHDMCNHIDNPHTQDLLNSTLFEEMSYDNANRFQSQQPEQSMYSNSEVWFRAATIAVPICGAVILFVLIALAVKILKSENENFTTRKLSSPCERYDKYDHFDRYDCIVRKHYPQHHHNIYFSHQPTEDHPRQIHAPLLVQNTITSYHSGNKNETNAKLNLMQCETVSDYLESGKSIMSEIEKEVSSKSSDVNIIKNMNSGVKCSDAKYSDSKFAKDRHII